jgi:hypothetical protein
MNLIIKIFKFQKFKCFQRAKLNAFTKPIFFLQRISFVILIYKNMLLWNFPLLPMNSCILFSHWNPFIQVRLFPNFSLKYFLSLWTQRVQTETVTMGENFWASGQDFLSFFFLSVLSLSLFFLLIIFLSLFLF